MAATTRRRDDVAAAAGRLQIESLDVAFGETLAVDGVDLDLAPGGILAVLGPSGCGKSTLLRTIAGLEQPAAGRVRIDGRDLAGVPTHRRGVGLMFQDGVLFPHLDAARNVGYALRLAGVARGERRARVSELLELVGLTGLADRSPAALSGGEQQRVALARALAAQPRLLLLDEPLSSLDRELRERLAGELRTILRRTGATTVLVTHDHDEAFTIADEVAVMRAGRVVQRGPVAQVWRAPADPGVARFLGYPVVLDGAAARLLDPAAARVAMRPGALRLDDTGPVRARVLDWTVVREGVRLEVELVDADGVRAQALAPRDLAPDDVEGGSVRLRVEPTELATWT